MGDETAPHQGLQSLTVWVKAKDLAIFICSRILPDLPDEEKYALASQLRRSSQSIAANIAEVYGRYYYQEVIRFAYIARGSLLETNNHLIYAKEMSYLNEEEFLEVGRNMDELLKMIHGYINYLRKSKQGANEPGSQSSSTVT